MTASDRMKAETLKEKLTSFLKTMPRLADNEQWDTLQTRWMTCLQLIQEIIELEAR